MEMKQALETLDRATALVQTDRMGHQQIITALQAVQQFIGQHAPELLQEAQPQADAEQPIVETKSK